MNKQVLTLLALALILVITGACDSTNLAASNATAIPSRTPRPTFTPRPSATTEAADTATTVATATTAATEAPTVAATDTVAPTAKPVVKATPKPVQPTAIPPTAKPQFSIVPGTFSPNGQSAYQCPNESPVYEVIINAKKVGTPPRPYVEGLWFGIFQGGQLLTDYGGKKLIRQTSDGRTDSGYAYGSNCAKSGSVLEPDRFNGKLDVFDVIKSGTKTVTVRFVRSDSDLTPISPDVNVTFSQSGAYWLYFDVR